MTQRSLFVIFNIVLSPLYVTSPWSCIPNCRRPNTTAQLWHDQTLLRSLICRTFARGRAARMGRCHHGHDHSLRFFINCIGEEGNKFGHVFQSACFCSNFSNLLTFDRGFLHVLWCMGRDHSLLGFEIKVIDHGLGLGLARIVMWSFCRWSLGAVVLVINISTCFSSWKLRNCVCIVLLLLCSMYIFERGYTCRIDFCQSRMLPE